MAERVMPRIGLCACGCGQPTTRRFHKGHFSRKSGVEFLETADTHCWIWQLARNGAGYGKCKVDGKNACAHRVYYELLVGPIPQGLTLDHLCRNPACVNPGHLEPVTTRENILRGVGLSAQNARKTHCKHGHPFDAKNTRITPEGFRACRACERLRTRRRNTKRKAAA